jgi:serine/threonine protein kinase
MVHRDLKADNCFVDDKLMRVKVADFGTGHISARMQSTEVTPVPAKRPFPVSFMPRSRPDETRAVSKSMSTGGGSLLWMAPERLTGRRVSVVEAHAGDVYR